MKITNIDTYIVDAGWRPWTFVKVETDQGIIGYGECSDDVPWKDDLVTEPPEIIDGYMTIPKRPGWGTDLNEKELVKHLLDR